VFPAECGVAGAAYQQGAVTKEQAALIGDSAKSLDC
jgi:hypothetical protein